MKAQIRRSQTRAVFPDGNRKGSSRNLQVERWEGVIIGRRNSIRVFKGKGIMFLESVIGLALNTQVLKISKQLGNNMSSGSLSSYYTS